MATAAKISASLNNGDNTPGGGQGRQEDPPTNRLSKLIATLNDRFGMNLTDEHDLVRAEPQAVKGSEEARIVALNNDQEPFRIFLEVTPAMRSSNVTSPP